MIKHNQDGSALTVAIMAILSVGLIAALTFGVWAFTGQQDYKQNVDTKVAAAVEVAKKEEAVKQTALAAEAAKSPVLTYQGPKTYGSLTVSYPKTWSAYVDAKSNGDAVIDGYFAPQYVPSITDPASVFALRVKIINQPYATAIKEITSLQSTGSSVVPYSLPKVPSVVGIKVTGKITTTKDGVLIMLPLRDKTLLISTEGNSYVNDLNTYVLPSVSFLP